MNNPKLDIVVWGVGTPRTLRVYWALHELDVGYRSEAISTRTPTMEREDFLRVSPGSKIPGLQHGGLMLTESGAITRYLMDTFSTQEWDASERAQMNRWIFFVLMELDATALYVIRRHEGLPNIYGAAPQAVASAYEYLERQLAVLENVLRDGRDYVLGEIFSEADIHLGTCLGWATLLNVELASGLADYLQRLRARPAFQAASVANGRVLGT